MWLNNETLNRTRLTYDLLYGNLSSTQERQMKYLSIITIVLSFFCMILFVQEMPPVSDNEVGIVEQLPPHYPESLVIHVSNFMPLCHVNA